MDCPKKIGSEPQNEYELPNYSSALSKLPEISDNNSAQDDVKVKVEIELKEAENDLIYETDFYGHLRLVNINQIASDTNSDIKSKGIVLLFLTNPDFVYIMFPKVYFLCFSILL